MKTNYADLKVGDEVFFANEKLPMKVRARNERYAVVTREIDAVEDAELLENEGYSSKEDAEGYPIYSLLDFEDEKKAPDNCFCAFEYAKDEECETCIAHLVSGEVELSRRHGVGLQIDWKRTNSNLKIS